MLDTSSHSSTARVLIVDRDSGVVDRLRPGLEDAAFSVIATTDLGMAIASLAKRPPQLVILDWNLPCNAGLKLVQAVRAVDSPPGIGLIILSGLAAEHDIVTGLNLGADDYIAKPFSVREVVARAQAVVRMRARNARADLLACGDLVLDAANHRAMAGNRLLNLSPLEFRLLEFLMEHPGRTFNRAQLLAEVWGAGNDIDERTVDVNVLRLRKLLEAPGCAEYIQTIRGFGYRFAAPTLTTSIA